MKCISVLIFILNYFMFTSLHFHMEKAERVAILGHNVIYCKTYITKY